jgi:hypothetical protein
MFPLLFAWLVLLGPTGSEVDYYDGRLTQIARGFRAEIMDRDACRKRYQEAGQVVEDLQQQLKENEYPTQEREALKRLLEEARALENYISCVGDCANDNPSIDQFFLANRRVGGSIYPMEQYRFCVEVFYVAIDDYTALMVKNNSSRKFRVEYRWSWSRGTGKGQGNGGCGVFEREVNEIWNNRGNPTLKTVVLEDVSCQDLGF